MYKLHLVGYIKYTSSDARFHERFKFKNMYEYLSATPYAEKAETVHVFSTSCSKTVHLLIQSR